MFGAKKPGPAATLGVKLPPAEKLPPGFGPLLAILKAMGFDPNEVKAYAEGIKSAIEFHNATLGRIEAKLDAIMREQRFAQDAVVMAVPEVAALYAERDREAALALRAVNGND